MQFTRLRLLGFKSFVDPTELVIAPGLTGVVGPNGCGKSNLLEALRWVMGENRPTAMRGDGMEDVIFAGSAARPARNHAEVTLTLDNSDRLAPAALNDDDTLDIIRRITREAGSAYRVNGREARARDVQMLFADASTGAHSPALVRQGQISELINARPKARRRVLEEAAGISGLYQRRHEAELKLRATEANLGRVGDVIEALEGQLAQLARQARAAARYREIAEALRRAESLLIWRLWHDAEVERAVAAEALLEATRAAGIATTEAGRAGRAREAAGEALPELREEDTIAAAVLQRLQVERDRIEAESEAAARRISDLEALSAQIAADSERESALDRDAGETVAGLAEERTALEAEDSGHDAQLAVARETAEAAAVALRAAEAEFDRRAEAAARLVAAHEAAARVRCEAEKRAGDAGRALTQSEEALVALRRDRDVAGRAMQTARNEAGNAARAAEAAEAQLSGAEAAHGEARATDQSARARFAEAEGALKAVESELTGLEKLRLRPEGDAAQILDRIEAAPGFEEALGAAFAEDLAQPELGPDETGSGWRALAGTAAGPGLPEGAAPLTGQVRAPAALDRRLGATGVVDREAGPRLQAALAPGQKLVSREGDLWRWDGLCVAAADAPSAAAARLRQRNRLTELDRQAGGLRAEAASAGAARDAAAVVLADCAAAEASARTARKAADQAAAEAARALIRAETAAETLESRLGGLEAGRRRRAEEAEAARAALAEAEVGAGALADPGEAQAAVAAERTRVEAARITMLTRRAEAEDLSRTGAARQRRLGEIARESASWGERQANAAARLADLARRADAAAAELSGARTRPEELAARQGEMAGALTEAETRRRNAAEALTSAEAELRDLDAAARMAEHRAGEAREARARAEALGEAAETRAGAAVERLRSEIGLAPEAVLARAGVEAEAVPEAAVLEAEAMRLRQQRDGLGAVNLRAEEDAREVRGELDDLVRERDDLDAAVAKLRHGINGLNREGRGRLLEAFEEVNRNFSALFRHLFGGGQAELVLVESDDPLEAGLEIMCQPPGKKLSTLSLLSGGEQSLTALSLIFAVFLANPAPICVLDEVDAPLDDANVGRFCDLLDEMINRTQTRFLIITHHAVTMARMDRLFGVTMAEQGVSQLVSVDLAAAERIVEPA